MPAGPACIRRAALASPLVPNRNARLYLRVHQASLDRDLLERDEMMLATLRALRVAGVIAAVPQIHASWLEATREAIGHLDEARRGVVETLLREALGLMTEGRPAGDVAPADAPGVSRTGPGPR